MHASGRDLASADATTTVADAVMDATSAVRTILCVQECSAITRHHLSRSHVREEVLVGEIFPGVVEGPPASGLPAPAELAQRDRRDDRDGYGEDRQPGGVQGCHRVHPPT